MKPTHFTAYKICEFYGLEIFDEILDASVHLKEKSDEFSFPTYMPFSFYLLICTFTF